MPDKKGRIGCTPVLFGMCFAVTVGSILPVGYCLGSVNTPAEFIKAWARETALNVYGVKMGEMSTDVLWASIVSMLPVGGICGSFIVGTYGNVFGRKGSLMISGVLMVTGAIFHGICRICHSIELILLGRLIVGIAAAMIFTVQPMYFLEISPLHLRGLLGIFTCVGVTGGVVVGQIFSLKQTFGTDALWEYAIGLFGVFALVCLIPIFWFPESPRMLLLVREDEEKAKIALKKLRHRKEIDEYIANELAGMKSIKTGAAKFLTVLRSFEFRLPLVLVCSYFLCQNLSGYQPIFFYSISIFTKSGFSLETATWLNLGAGVLNFVCTITSSVLIRKVDRRPLMLISTGGCTASLILLAITLKYIDMVSFFPQLSMVGMALYFIFFSMGLGPITLFIGVELFEVAPRTVAMSMGNLFSWTGNFLVGMCFPLLIDTIGALCFLPCAAACFYACVLTFFYLPETRGRHASDTKNLVANGFRSKVRVKQEDVPTS